MVDDGGMKRKIISSDPEVMGSTPCFAGTRVPVQTLLDYLEGFPTVKREHVIAFLETATEQMVASAR